MFFQIIMNPNTAKWNIRISKFTFMTVFTLWVVLRGKNGTESISEVKEFGTHDEAIKFIKNAGIDKVYSDYNEYQQSARQERLNNAIRG